MTSGLDHELQGAPARCLERARRKARERGEGISIEYFPLALRTLGWYTASRRMNSGAITPGAETRSARSHSCFAAWGRQVAALCPPGRSAMSTSKIEDMLQKELDQAKAGIHQRQKGEEKRLATLKQARLKRAEQLRQLRNDTVETQFEAVRSEVCTAARPNNRCPRIARALQLHSASAFPRVSHCIPGGLSLHLHS